MIKILPTRQRVVWFCLFMDLLAAGFCALGYWQLQRLEWKTHILAAIDAAYANPAPIDLHAALGDYQKNPNPFFVRYGTLRGIPFDEQSLRIGPRTRAGVVGEYLVTPIIVENPFDADRPALVIMVQRGWLDSTTPPPLLVPPGEPLDTHVTFTGSLRPYPRPNLFVPPNDPFADHWAFLREADARIRIARNMGADAMLVPLVFEVHGAVHAGLHPIREGDRPSNNHLSYAVFWFVMAGLTIFLTGFYVQRTNRMTIS